MALPFLASTGNKSELESTAAMGTGDVDELAARLRRAVDNETRVLALELGDRERILLALDDPPAGLEELRATLLQEHTWRVEQGL